MYCPTDRSIFQKSDKKVNQCFQCTPGLEPGWVLRVHFQQRSYDLMDMATAACPLTLPKGSRFINKSGASPTGDLNFFGRRHGLGNPNLHLMLVCQSILNFFRAFLDIYFRFTSCLRVVKMLKMVVKIPIFDLI